jgi:Na+/citrate or Na+/malate symporter
VNDALDITAAVKQRLAWDIVACDEIAGMWETLGLVPPSEDVSEVAHAESHARMATVAPLGIMGEIYIVLASEIISNVMSKHYEELHGDLPSDAERSIMKQQNEEVIRAAVYPVLAHLLESGMIQLGPTVYADAAMRLI